jgi:rhamnosyltransferase
MRILVFSDIHANLNALNTVIDDAGEFGLKTAFISNSFAAYRISSLTEVGGFPNNVIFGEDMYVAAKMLKAGYKIAYAADACVYHSHGYSLWQEMKRYFDMGVFHAREPWIRQELGGAEGEGVKFVVSEIKYLLRNAFWRIPEALLRTLVRYSGFRLGLVEKRLPIWLKKWLAMNKAYFEN